MVNLDDVVVLKSGGPRMVVSEIHESDNMLVCVYYSFGKIDTVWVHSGAVVVVNVGSAAPMEIIN